MHSSFLCSSLITGFIQPDVLFNIIHKCEAARENDGFLAHMTIVTPRLVSYEFDDFDK
jgi:hypothetical protein